jgi:rhodanese-related sulfurtransferase
MVIKQLLVLLGAAVVISLAVNTISPNRIPLMGEYRELSSGDGPIVPPTAEPGDPPFISIDQARVEFDMGTALFVDAREVDEFECGTIPGAVNIPFESLPDVDLERYFDSAFGAAGADRALITFCSGEECDLSLHLARNLKALGYGRALIFFGGAREWEKSGFEVERRAACEN